MFAHSPDTIHNEHFYAPLTFNAVRHSKKGRETQFLFFLVNNLINFILVSHGIFLEIINNSMSKLLNSFGEMQMLTFWRKEIKIMRHFAAGNENLRRSKWKRIFMVKWPENRTNICQFIFLNKLPKNCVHLAINFFNFFSRC